MDVLKQVLDAIMSICAFGICLIWFVSEWQKR
jgi:hypothetical protein